MAAHRRYGRFVGTTLVGGPLLVAGVICASPAQADEASYLNDLHNSGIRDLNGGDPAMLQIGYKLCQQMSYGAPPEQLVALALQRSDGQEGPNGLTPVMANNLIAYTAQDLCPPAH
jgi:Protein of unknown function (DUF732)